MEHWIEASCEPRELILAWQPGDATSDRFRWAVARIVPQGDDFELRYFERGSEFEKFNAGKSFEGLCQLGYTGYPAFAMSQPLHRTGVRAALMRRLPPRRRSDFSKYAKQFRLRPDGELSDFSLLGRTEAKLPSDGFSLVDWAGWVFHERR